MLTCVYRMEQLLQHNISLFLNTFSMEKKQQILIKHKCRVIIRFNLENILTSLQRDKSAYNETINQFQNRNFWQDHKGRLLLKMAWLKLARF